MLGEEAVADVDLVFVQPLAMVVEVDPANDCSIHVDASGRTRVWWAFAQEPAVLIVSTSTQNNSIRWLKRTHGHQTVAYGTIEQTHGLTLGRN